jgi:hypothetical protein
LLDHQPSRDSVIVAAQPIVEATWNNYQRGARRPYGLMEWPALLRKLERIDPSYRS